MRRCEYLSANLSITFSNSSSFTLSECIDSSAKLDNLSSSIVVLKCVFISLRQLKDLSDARDITGIEQAIRRSLLSSLKASSYLETKLQKSRSVEVFSPNTGIALSAVLRLIIRLICFNSSAKSPLFDLYCSANFVMELYSRNWPEPGVRAPMPHMFLLLRQNGDPLHSGLCKLSLLDTKCRLTVMLLR